MNAEVSLSPAAIDALADDIAEVAAHIDAAVHRLLVLIREFDRVGGWHRQGALSCAHWLSWRIGLGPGPAREKVRVAHALAGLPLIDEALRRGELSYSKVRAMTRVATASNEAALLDQARNTTAAQLERICRLYRQTQPSGPDPRQVDDRRWVAARPTDDSMVSIQIRLLPDEAARVMRAIEAAAAAEQGSLADGAVALADAALVSAPAGGPVRPPVEVVVHVAAETLEGHTEAGDAISADTCRRLLCDAGVVPLVEDAAGRTVDVGRKTRTIPAALRRALHARDAGCRFPGCSNRRSCDAHHVVHWIDGGETRLSNTHLVCRRHHRYLHEHGFRVEQRDRELLFFDPGGRPIEAVAAATGVGDHWMERLRALHGEVGVSAASNLPGWDGDGIDYDRCVGALC